jgi:hypothetical protein
MYSYFNGSHGGWGLGCGGANQKLEKLFFVANVRDEDGQDQGGIYVYSVSLSVLFCYSLVNCWGFVF